MIRLSGFLLSFCTGCPSYSLVCHRWCFYMLPYIVTLISTVQMYSIWQHIQNSIDDKLKDKMDSLYKKLNQKLDNLVKQSQIAYNNIKNTNIPHRLINITNMTFIKEHIRILAHGPNYALAKDPKDYISELITDTESAIRQLDSKIQNTFRYMASTKIKQIMTTNTHHTLHERYQ